LVTLLIAEAWRREGKKVTILSANKTLAHQMKEQEADFLGVQTVLMEGRGSDIPPAHRRSYNRRSEHRDHAFRWQRLRSSLSEANIYLDRDSISVRPGVYPLESNSHYSSLTQCLIHAGRAPHPT
jgi:hypothetical protein